MFTCIVLLSSQLTLNSSLSISSKIVLLTTHFPLLRIIWSPGVHYTCQVFKELKEGFSEPDANEAAKIGADSLAEGSTIHHQALDMIQRLPGVNTNNYRKLTSCASNLKEVVSLKKEELEQTLGTKTGKDLFEFFNKKT